MGPNISKIFLYTGSGETKGSAMEKTITLITVLCLSLVSLHGASVTWDEDPSHSYGWIYDFSLNQDELKNMVDGEGTEVTISRNNGGYVLLFSMEYAGFHDDHHIFNYFGGYYSRGNIHLSMEFEYDGMPSTGEIPMNIKSVESDFQGSLWVREHLYQSSNVTAYGVVKQTVETRGGVDVAMDMDMTTKDKTSGLSLQYSLKNQWDMEMTVQYEPPLPWMPKSTSGFREDINASYSGHLQGMVKLNLDYDLPYPKVDQDIRTPLEGREIIPGDILFKGGNVYELPSPVLGCVNLGHEAVLHKAQVPDYQDGFLMDSLGSRKEARLDGQTYVYQRKPSIDGFFYEPCLRAANEYLGTDVLVLDSELRSSTSFTSGEVEAFRDDKEGFFQESITESGAPSWLLFAAIVGAVFITVLLMGIALFSKKKRPTKYYPEEPYQPPGVRENK